MNSAITVAKMLPLLVLLAGGLFAIDPDNLAVVQPPELSTLARSSILLIFAFAGIEAALVPSGEVKDPARTVPRALVIAMVLITLLYAGLQFVSQGVLGPALATSKTALADAAGVALGGWEDLLLVGMISMVGHAGGMILATPRMLFAVRARRVPAVGCRTPSSRLSGAGRDPRAIRRSCARHHQHVRAAGSPNLSILVVWRVLPGDVATPPSRRARWCSVRVPAAVVIPLACLVIGWILTSVTPGNGPHLRSRWPWRQSSSFFDANHSREEKRRRATTPTPTPG